MYPDRSVTYVPGLYHSAPGGLRHQGRLPAGSLVLRADEVCCGADERGIVGGWRPVRENGDIL